MTPEMIRRDYPEILSSEQVRQILGISKRKASWLLNNGHIPCQISEKETRKYEIQREDLIAYLNDREKHPEKYIVPKGTFSTAKTTQQKEEGFHIVLPQDFREWLEDEWCNLPDVLTADKIEKRTGYAKKTVLRWMRTKRQKHTVFSQPGMRYSIAKALVYSLKQDEYFQSVSEIDKEYIITKILDDVKGRMLEDIVLLETFKAASRSQEVFKFKFDVRGEYDMVIYDSHTNTCRIYEVKPSDKIVPQQTRFLRMEEL